MRTTYISQTFPIWIWGINLGIAGVSMPSAYALTPSIPAVKSLPQEFLVKNDAGDLVAYRTRNLVLDGASALQKTTLPLDDSQNRQASGAENFTPSLQILPAPVIVPPPEPEPKPISEKSSEYQLPTIKLDSIQTDFKSERDNFGQRNEFIKMTTQFRLTDDQKIILKIGKNSFALPGSETITNLPLQIGWQGKIGKIKFQPEIGINTFDRLSSEVNLHLTTTLPISPSAALSFAIDKEIYKSNATVLKNRISAWHYSPSLYWQINRKTSLFSMYRRGNYNDGNIEQQSFSRLEHKMGQFSVAANLFTWSYAQDRQQRSGYFSPPDFLVYGGELAWEGNVTEFLRCRLAGTIGEQRLNGKTSSGNGYQTRCTVKVSSKIEADLGYAFSNDHDRVTGATGFSNREITGQLRINF